MSYSFNADESGQTWESKLVSTCDAVVTHLSSCNKRQNKIYKRIENVAKAYQKTKEKSSDFILEMLTLKEENSVLSVKVEDSARDLYLVEEYREAMTNRMIHLSESNVMRTEDSYVANKTEVIELLKESNRCILAERKAMEQFKKSLIKPFHGNNGGGMFSQKKSSLEWDIGMKKAQWLEAHHQVEQMNKKVLEKLELIEISRAQNIRRGLKSFVEIEMVFHGRALELLTNSYKKLNGATEEWEHSDKLDWQKVKEQVGLNDIEKGIEKFKETGSQLCGEQDQTTLKRSRKISSNSSSHSIASTLRPEDGDAPKSNKSSSVFSYVEEDIFQNKEDGLFDNEEENLERNGKSNVNIDGIQGE